MRAAWAQRKYYRNWTLGVSMRFRSSWGLILHQSTQEKSSCRKLIFSPQLVLDAEISIFAFFAPSGAPTGSPREAPPRTLLWAVRRRLYGPCRLNPCAGWSFSHVSAMFLPGVSAISFSHAPPPLGPLAF